MKTLILGIGSPFADDQAGWFVADKLVANADLQKKIADGLLHIEVADRPGLNLLVWLQDKYQQVYLIDMVKTNLECPGTVYKLLAKEIIGFSGMLSSHSLGVSPSLALAQALGINIDNITFWGIEGQSVKPEDQISPNVLSAIDKVYNEVLNRLIGNKT